MQKIEGTVVCEVPITRLTVMGTQLQGTRTKWTRPIGATAATADGLAPLTPADACAQYKVFGTNPDNNPQPVTVNAADVQAEVLPFGGTTYEHLKCSIPCAKVPRNVAIGSCKDLSAVPDAVADPSPEAVATSEYYDINSQQVNVLPGTVCG